MNAITRENLIYHELIGLEASVLSSPNSGYLGIKGKVIDETKGTLLISDDPKRKRVPKSAAVFRLTLPDGSIVEVDGRYLIGTPIERIKMVGRKSL